MRNTSGHGRGLGSGRDGSGVGPLKSLDTVLSLAGAVMAGVFALVLLGGCDNYYFQTSNISMTSGVSVSSGSGSSGGGGPLLRWIGVPVRAGANVFNWGATLTPPALTISAAGATPFIEAVLVVREDNVRTQLPISGVFPVKAELSSGSLSVPLNGFGQAFNLTGVLLFVPNSNPRAFAGGLVPPTDEVPSPTTVQFRAVALWRNRLGQSNYTPLNPRFNVAEFRYSDEDNLPALRDLGGLADVSTPQAQFLLNVTYATASAATAP